MTDQNESPYDNAAVELARRSGDVLRTIEKVLQYQQDEADRRQRMALADEMEEGTHLETSANDRRQGGRRRGDRRQGERRQTVDDRIEQLQQELAALQAQAQHLTDLRQGKGA